ncbi:NUDIX hydrolase [Streptomyces aureus]|uniref:NUDIX hydrolase n=1 Tax=Streptomyces aureus TaxID=193461 RepID=UPI0033F0F9B4
MATEHRGIAGPCTAYDGLPALHAVDADLPLREAARAVLLDADRRVLLLRYAEQGGYWATPGGSLEEGGTHAAATLRELNEELGFSPTSVQLGMQLAQRSTEHLVGEREVRQVERYFLAHASPADVHVDHAAQRDNIQTHRWWTLGELRSTRETVYPAGLADLIAAVADGQHPERPVILAG